MHVHWSLYAEADQAGLGTARAVWCNKLQYNQLKPAHSGSILSCGMVAGLSSSLCIKQILMIARLTDLMSALQNE